MKQYLLPRNAKFVGILLIAIGFIIVTLINKHLIEPPFKEEISRNILRAIILSGFLLIILAKEKIEDEFINSYRLFAFRGSFLFSLIFYIVNIITGDETKTSFYILFSQALIYLSLFYTFKKGVIKW